MRLSSPVAVLISLAATEARAAYETAVLTAAEPQNAFDLHLSVGWDRAVKRGKITREWVQEEGANRTSLDVKELDLRTETQRLILNLRAGIFHDLELHASAPIVLFEDSELAFAEGVAGRSTIIGSTNADDPDYADAPRYPITDVPGERHRAGFGDMSFGLGWSPFVDLEADGEDVDAWPTITLRADVIAPTGPTRVATEAEALDAASGGNVGEGVTAFDLSIGASRRFGVSPTFDPFVLFGARIPVATPKQKERGMTPPVSGRFEVGSEVVFFEHEATHQRYAFSAAFNTEFVGTGRTFSELSDYFPNFDQTRVLANRTEAVELPDLVVYGDYANPANYVSKLDGARCGKIEGVACGELHQVDEHVTLGGTFALDLRFAEFGVVRGGVSIDYVSDHFLTNERVGKDLDPAALPDGTQCDGADCKGRVNARNSFFDRTTNTCPAGQTCDERSAYYDPRYDSPGRRFRLEETTNFTIFVAGAATF
ncbi:MAG: hypothetical protein HYV07_07525 [Deltaproteobacteria bacterium]|nr:hypothetical protein [Deltaproteobacteria bacterium]